MSPLVRSKNNVSWPSEFLLVCTCLTGWPRSNDLHKLICLYQDNSLFCTWRLSQRSPQTHFLYHQYCSQMKKIFQWHSYKWSLSPSSTVLLLLTLICTSSSWHHHHDLHDSCEVLHQNLVCKQVQKFLMILLDCSVLSTETLLYYTELPLKISFLEWYSKAWCWILLSPW